MAFRIHFRRVEGSQTISLAGTLPEPKRPMKAKPKLVVKKTIMKRPAAAATVIKTKPAGPASIIMQKPAIKEAIVGAENVWVATIHNYN
jgi:hypothetical protein